MFALVISIGRLHPPFSQCGPHNLKLPRSRLEQLYEQVPHTYTLVALHWSLNQRGHLEVVIPLLEELYEQVP